MLRLLTVNKNLTKNGYFIILLVIALVLIIFSFLLINSFSLFPTPKDQAEEVYVNPETGEETFYNPNYITEEELKLMDKHFEEIDEQYKNALEPTPVPE